MFTGCGIRNEPDAALYADDLEDPALCRRADSFSTYLLCLLRWEER